MEPYEEEPSYDDDELVRAFNRMYPNGFGGADVIAAIAPDGWDKSPWGGPKVPFELPPDMQKMFDESTAQMKKFLEMAKQFEPPPPTAAEIDAKYGPKPVTAEPDAENLVGRCIWDIFSDNHEVFDADDERKLDLGSSRGSGEWLATYLNRRTRREGEQYEYYDYHLGNGMAEDKEQLMPIYRMIFLRMKALGLDWKYHFPRLYAVDFRPLKKKMDEKKREEEGIPEFEGYDPAAAFEEEEKEREHDEELAKMREGLDEMYRESVEASKDRPPPEIVRAYQDIYGEFPRGWPPEAAD